MNLIYSDFVDDDDDYGTLTIYYLNNFFWISFDKQNKKFQLKIFFFLSVYYSRFLFPFEYKGKKAEKTLCVIWMNEWIKWLTFLAFDIWRLIIVLYGYYILLMDIVFLNWNWSTNKFFSPWNSNEKKKIWNLVLDHHHHH